MLVLLCHVQKRTSLHISGSYIGDYILIVITPYLRTAQPLVSIGNIVIGTDFSEE